MLTIVLAILMWGVLYQMWNATFASFFQELFPTRTRVTGFAISQNIGLAITAFLPTVFAVIAPPGSTERPAPDRRHLLGADGRVGRRRLRPPARRTASRSTRSGRPDAVPVPREEFERIRTATV